MSALSCIFTASLQLANYMGTFKKHHMDLYFVLGPLPLAHYLSMALIANSKQKILYRDITKIITIHNITVISHRPSHYHYTLRNYTINLLDDGTYSEQILAS